MRQEEALAETGIVDQESVCKAALTAICLCVIGQDLAVLKRFLPQLPPYLPCAESPVTSVVSGSSACTEQTTP